MPIISPPPSQGAVGRRARLCSKDDVNMYTSFIMASRSIEVCGRHGDQSPLRALQHFTKACLLLKVVYFLYQALTAV